MLQGLSILASGDYVNGGMTCASEWCACDGQFSESDYCVSRVAFPLQSTTQSQSRLIWWQGGHHYWFDIDYFRDEVTSLHRRQNEQATVVLTGGTWNDLPLGMVFPWQTASNILE